MTFVHEKDMSEDWIKVNQLPVFIVDEKKLHLKKKKKIQPHLSLGLESGGNVQG